MLSFDASPEEGARTGAVRVSAPGATPPHIDVTVVQSGTTQGPVVARFEFGPIGGTYAVGQPVPVLITALDASRDIASYYNGTASLSANSSALVSPLKLTFQSGQAFGNLSLDLPFANTILRADAKDVTGSSNPFAVTDSQAPTGCISGLVLDGPLAGPLSIEIQDYNGAPIARPSAPLGVYRACGLPPASYTVHATKGDWRSLTKQIAVRANDFVTVNLELFDSNKPPVLLVGGILGSRELAESLPVITGEPCAPDPWDLELIDWAPSFWEPFQPFLQVWQPLKDVLQPYFTPIAVPWDWRAPIDECTIEKYLLPVIDEAKGLNDKVYIAAHSAGGLLVRAYIQSELYMDRQDIDSFAMVAPPNQGAAILYYLWEGADPKKADTIPHPDTSLYSKTIAEIFRKIEGTSLYNGDNLLVAQIDLWQFIRHYFPSVGDLMSTKPFLLRNGREHAALDVPKPRILEDLKASDTRFRMVAGSPTADDEVRTRVFLSNSIEPEHSVAAYIRVGPQRFITGIYADGEPDSGEPLRGRGDGTVLYYDLSAVGLGHLDLDARNPGKHAEMMGVYANEICEFLNYGACDSGIMPSAIEREQTNAILSFQFEGRVQPFVFDPTGPATGVVPSILYVVHDIPGSSLEIAPTGAAINIVNPSHGVYSVDLTAVPGDVYSVEINFRDELIDEQVSFRGIYHDEVIGFQIDVKPDAEPAILLWERVGCPQNMALRRNSWVESEGWGSAPDPGIF